MMTPEITHSVEILGWTLLHSLWQSFIILTLFVLAMRLFAHATPLAKYVAGLCALLLMICTSIATFMYFEINLFSHSTTLNGASAPFTFTTVTDRVDDASLLAQATGWINAHLSELVIGWVAGMTFFALRLASVWQYSVRLQKNATVLSAEWQAKLNALTAQLKITRIVLLAQSASVNVPIVLGYVKPVILLPIGMIAGFSTEQIETIILHELAHIRRHDYLINLLQSLTEVVFFFNPFVWIISSQIRQERELCCDDIVVNLKSRRAYAEALHQLEESRLWNTGVALAATGTKNKLLQRIKRIMETSEKKVEGSGKMFPAFVVVLIVIAASWISVQARRPEKKELKVIAADTVITGKKEASASRKSLTTIDSKGTPHTEVIESYDDLEETPEPADIQLEDLELDVVPNMAFDFSEITPAPDMAFDMAFDSSLSINLFNADQFAGLDTMPADHFKFRRDKGDWSEFEKEFTERFQQEFGDFYQKNKPEFEKMMRDLERQREVLVNDVRVKFKGEKDLQRLATKNLDFAIRMRERADVDRQFALADRNYNRQKLNAIHIDKRQAYDNHRQASFEKQITEQLVKDGYLSKDDAIKTINWKGDGLEINGKKIKQADMPKYDELHRKYLREGHIGHAE